MMRVEEILMEEIGKRCSRRKFSEEKITVEKETEILKIIKKINDDVELKFKGNINHGKEVFAGFRASYGLIRGCSSYVALAGDSRDKLVEEKIGYYGEYLVLKLTQMGLGTCWVGGTYDKKATEKNIKTEHNDKIYCVIALGNLENKEKSGFEKVIGFFGKNRKGAEELLVNIDEIKEKEREWIFQGIESVRKAPSALNSQPWLFSYDGENIFIRADRKKTGFEKIDTGIAMLHFQMGAESAGYRGKWEFIENDWKFIKLAGEK